MKEKKFKKIITGYTYADDNFKFESISAWGYLPGVNVVVLKRKKDMGNFKYRKVKVTVEEL